MFEWGDIGVMLATARSGSTHAAARALGVNQTTVARRIAALEEALRVRLFERTATGYRLTEAGAAVLPQAERVAAEAETFARLAAQEARRLSGVVRVTASESVANVVVTPWLSEFMERYPDIRIEVIATDTRLDLARGEADVAIRATREINDPGVVYRKLAEGGWGMYCSRAYRDRRGAPTCPEQLDSHFVIGADGELARLEPYRWLAQHTPRAAWRSISSTVSNTVAAIKAGQGVAPLPRSVGDVEQDLVCCFRLPCFGYGYYLVTRESLKDVPRIRAVTDFIVQRACRMREALEGR